MCTVTGEFSSEQNIYDPVLKGFTLQWRETGKNDLSQLHRTSAGAECLGLVGTGTTGSPWRTLSSGGA